MAFPTAVNSQITDAVTQANVTTLGSAPAQAIGALYQAAAHATSLSMQNAVTHRHSMNQVNTAVVTACVTLLASTSVPAAKK